MIGILTDVTRCIGCERCVAACVKENGLEKQIPAPQHKGDGLASNRWTSVVKKDGRFVRKQCRHCLEPACVSACLVGAMQKRPNGPVVYDKGRCMGCRYCMMACPFGIPRYQWEKAIPYVRKCTLCFRRLDQGKQPACTEACPKEATVFGERDDLLKEAKKRMRENPGRYLNKIYGEFEVGGVSVLYLSDVPLDFLAWKPGLGNEPLPALTWHALSKVPGEFLGMGALMTGVFWIIERRNRVNKAKPHHEDHEAHEDKAKEISDKK